MIQQQRKPAQRLFTGLAGSPLCQPQAEKSAAALRAQQWRMDQKQNAQFHADEAKRKRLERKHQREQRILNDWAKQGFPSHSQALSELRKAEDRSGVFVSGAPRGKGKLVTGGYNPNKLELISGIRTADGEMSAVPLRAQFTDQELESKLKSIDGIQAKIDLILERWQHDQEFCDFVRDLSLDQVTAFVAHCTDNPEYARELLYEHTEHQAVANPLSHAQPHGRHVTPSGISDAHDGDLPSETELSFSRKISFKRADTETLLIGSRNARFHNLQNGTAVEHFEGFVRDNVSPESTRDIGGWTTPSGPMVCKLCQEQIAAQFNLQIGFEHFGTEHRQHVIDNIRWFEAKAWRPRSRKCSMDHKAKAAACSGPDKLYCGKCRKLLYRPTRSDTPTVTHTANLVAA